MRNLRHVQPTQRTMLCDCDCIDPRDNGCAGEHRARFWDCLMKYRNAAGTPTQSMGATPARTNPRNARVKICRLHYERLRPYSQFIRPPTRLLSVAQEYAVMQDAMEQHRKLPGKPYEELMRADELPAGARTSLMPEEPEQLLIAQRKLEKAAALKEELAAKVQALETEAIQAVLNRVIEQVEHTCEEAQPKRLRVC